MIQDHDIKVLAELSRIVGRYGPDSVTRLATLIRDPQSAAALATALEAAVDMASHSRGRTKSRNTNRVGMGVLNQLRESNPQKHSVVAELRDHLISGTVLHSMSELRRFARTHGFSIGKATSRNAAIAPFLQSISELSTDEIFKLLNLLIQPKNDDRSLQSWRDLIVKQQLPKNLAENDLQ